MADGTFEPAGAADALEAMRSSRARLMQNACPPWRHALFAGLMSGVVAAQAAPVRVFFALMGVGLLGAVVFAGVMRLRKGMFVNGWRAGATRGVSLAIFGVYMAIYTTTWWLRIERGLWAAPLAGAVILFPMAWYASRRWMQVYRAELQA